MASIPEHIKNLLFEQDCVVVPDFGGFITNFHGAVLRQHDASLLPPRKRVAFNEVLKFDDGLLTTYIALKEGRSREEVRSRIRLFVEHAWRELRLHTVFRVEHLGSFTLNAERKLVFEPDHRINFFGESFGMNAVAARPRRNALIAPTTPVTAARLEVVREGILEVVPEEVVSEEIRPLDSRQRWLSLTNVAASTGIVLLSLIGWFWFEGNDSTLSSLNPFSIFSLSEWKKTPVVSSIPSGPHAQSARVASPKPSVAGNSHAVKGGPTTAETTSLVSSIESAVSRELVRNVLVVPMRIRTTPGKISTSPGRYFVVAGGFSKAANAQRFQQKLQKQGFGQALLLYPVKSRLIRVATQEFDTMQQAQQASVRSRSVLGDHVWVLKTK